MFSRRRAEVCREESVYVDQWKKDCYLKNLCESRSSYSRRSKENQGGIVGTETSRNGKTYFSPAPAIWNPEVTFTLPRSSGRGFNGGRPRREIWGRDVEGSSKQTHSTDVQERKTCKLRQLENQKSQI
ncbi:hypothetical protein EV2_039001 [Malus domestica]